MSDLIRIMALLYRMNAADIQTLSQELLDARKRAWQSALAEEVRAFGCQKTPRAPSGRDLNELKAMSLEDAQSIAQTWNRDIERQLEQIYQTNPRANRHTYIKRMREWEAKRAAWKNAQIALNTTQQTHNYARSRFFQENGLRGSYYIMTGPTPVCRECTQIMAMGILPEAFVQRKPCPRHVNCTHQYSLVTRPQIACDELWVG